MNQQKDYSNKVTTVANKITQLFGRVKALLVINLVKSEMPMYLGGLNPNYICWTKIEEQVKNMDSTPTDWIRVSDRLPETFPELVIQHMDKYTPAKTVKLLVLTDMGTVTDNRRVKKQVGNKEWAWLMGYGGETVTHYKRLTLPQ